MPAWIPQFPLNPQTSIAIMTFLLMARAETKEGRKVIKRAAALAKEEAAKGHIRTIREPKASGFCMTASDEAAVIFEFVMETVADRERRERVRKAFTSTE